ncbi:MAG: DUF262 domain-containing protein [Alphaproteobacteria bacterium]|jgi:uncharacterized protein with ParB-like and HNH nuclease domain
MAKDNIQPQLKSISTYLKLNKNDIFVIPEYQREYSWTVTQCDDLFQSVESFIHAKQTEDKDPYFFGTIIVDCSEENKLSLIDGQQRTTSFLLLLKALLLRIEDKLDSLQNDKLQSDIQLMGLIKGLQEQRDIIFNILYKTDAMGHVEIENNWDLASKVVLLKNKSISEIEEYKPELKNILTKRTYTEAANDCYKIKRKKNDNKYTPYFRNFKFFYDQLAPEKYGEANLFIFAKTLLKECQVIEIRSWQVEQAIEMFNSLNSKGLPLSDANIISAKLYANTNQKEEFKKNWEELIDLVNQLETDKIINIDSVLQEYMYIRRALNGEYKNNDVTTPGVRNYYMGANGKILRQPEVLYENFLKIVKIWDKIRFYPVVKLLLKFNENIKIYLMSYLNRYEIDDISESLVTEFAECLIRLFTILELVDSGYSSSSFKTFLFNENLKLVHKDYACAQIKIDFDNHINKMWEKNKIQEELADYDKNILVFLNEYLYAKEKQLKFDIFDKVNIEHIMPASGRNLDSIRTDAGVTSKDEFMSIVNKLGNKILLEEKINKSIGNDWFKTKKQSAITDKAGYKNSKYNIARALVDYDSDVWTITDIETATKKAINRILCFIFND